MAPIRRRVSRRVVKTTFQECFEYDIPGFRGTTTTKRTSGSHLLNRPSILLGKAKNQPRNSDVKQEATRKELKTSNKNVPKVTTKTKPLVNKEKSKEESSKIQQNSSNSIPRVTIEPSNTLRSSVAKRIKVKKAFMGSDYKRFKSPQTRNRLKTIASSEKMKNDKPETDAGKLASTSSDELCKNTAASVDSVFDSKNWQPVVHLQKLSVNEPESSKSTTKGKIIASSRRRAHSSASSSSDLVIRLQKALKDPLAQGSKLHSAIDYGMSNVLVAEVPKGTQSAEISSSNVLSQHVLHGTDDVIYRERRNSNSGVLGGVFKRNITASNQAASDSAMEDWPDDSSDGSDVLQHGDCANVEDISSASALAEHDWATPHMSLFGIWREQFNCVANELRNTFDHLKTIIEEKNASISVLRRKLERYNDNTYHDILDHIIQDYDENDQKKPATVIINSIRRYSHSHC